MLMINDIGNIQRQCVISTSLHLKIFWDLLAAGGFMCTIFLAVYQSYRTLKTAHLVNIFRNQVLCCVLLFVCMTLTVHLPAVT